MTYLFEPPTYLERPETGNRLIDCWTKVTRGVTVLKTATLYHDEYEDLYTPTAPTAYTEITYPSQDDLAAAGFSYLGGHRYLVDDAEAAELTAAGYAVSPYTAPVARTSGSANPANVNGPQGPPLGSRTYS